jgi:hypothetical protein
MLRVPSPFVERDEDLIQMAERQLADAEEAYRVDPSDANRRRVIKAWSAVRRARGAGQANSWNELPPRDS